jgi:hypothetical protein
MKTSIALLVLPLMLSATAAHADEPLETGAPATVVSAPAVETRGTAADPNIDRAFILPTAMTQPGGSATYNNYELLLHGFTYGVTDHLQATLTVLAPIVADMPFVGIAAVKWQFLSTPRLHLAVQGSVGLAQQLSGGSDSIGTVGGGAFASVCLREDCSSLLSASATYQFAAGGSDGSRGSAQVVIYGGSIVHSVSPHVKLLGELTSATGRASSGDGFDNLPGALMSYGVRLHQANIAGDIGFIKPIMNGDDGGFLLGLPFASISYRWM